MQIRLVLASVLATALIACSANHRTTGSTCGAGIVAGHTLSSQTPIGASTVFIVIQDTNKQYFACSGSLIDRQLILTAQHCVDGAQEINAHFTDDATVSANFHNSMIKVNTWARYTPTGYATPHDLAILHLAIPAPSTYSVQPLPQADYDVGAATSFTAAGYGITAECGEDAGTLRATTFARSDFLESQLVTIHNTTFLYEQPGMLLFDQTRTGICEGDSGGPLYANHFGQIQLVGVTSFDVDTADNGNGHRHSCHGIGAFTDIRQNLDWIKSAGAKLNAGAPSN